MSTQVDEGVAGTRETKLVSSATHRRSVDLTTCGRNVGEEMYMRKCKCHGFAPET